MWLCQGLESEGCTDWVPKVGLSFREMAGSWCCDPEYLRIASLVPGAEEATQTPMSWTGITGTSLSPHDKIPSHAHFMISQHGSCVLCY